ncbi:MAG: methyltransferase domain-containing protein [Methanobacteriota archaeon]|nr:MAG: methyltransferase domain-containing protein [Euryarchaeota archaeon]
MIGLSKKELVKRQFSRRGGSYSGSIFSDEHILDRIAAFAGPCGGCEVLDIATGAGFLAFRFAEAAKKVVGIDLTREMIERAEALKDEKGASNVVFMEADVENLPFEDCSFDLVACRYSFHHFPHPEVALDEMNRVCRAGGRVLIIDGTAPEDPVKAGYLNEMESMRDPGHVHLYRASEFRELFSKSGFEIAREDWYEMDFYLEEWLDMADPDENVRRRVSGMMESCLKEDRCGLNVRRSNGKVMFTYRIGMFLGVKT